MDNIMIPNIGPAPLLDEWLDENVAQEYKDQPLAQHWARVGKVIEELGETITALIGVTGQNPRKGVTHGWDDVVEELADTQITAILAIQHFTKDEEQTRQILEDRWNYRLRKMKEAQNNV